MSTALPSLGRVFDEADIASWVGTAYMLTSTAFQPLYGRLSDIFGRKSILIGNLLIFLLGSILCAVSKNMIMLIVCRTSSAYLLGWGIDSELGAVAGIGGGGITTTVTIVVSDVVSLQDRGKYQGIIGVVVSAATALGPVVGGLFTEKVSWRWCFVSLQKFRSADIPPSTSISLSPPSPSSSSHWSFP